jgi:hypothetical protein
MFEQHWKYSHVVQLQFGKTTYFANAFLIIFIWQLIGLDINLICNQTYSTKARRILLYVSHFIE